MRVLAIDPGSASGWYFTDGDTIRLTTFVVTRKATKGQRLKQFFKYGRTFKDIDHLIYEDPYVASFKSARFQYAMTGLIEILAAEHSAELTVLHPTTLKKFATGTGRATKDEMIARAQEECDVSVNDEHQADAYWLYRLWLSNQASKNE